MTTKTGAVQRKRAQSSVTALKRRGAITCKSPFRHDWDLVGPVPNRRRTRSSFGVLVSFRCTHCGSHRFWVLSRLTGEKLTGWYAPSEEYRALLDLELSVNEWRAAWMDELDNEFLEDLSEQTPPPPPPVRKRAAS